jgi:hypothetical protein
LVDDVEQVAHVALQVLQILLSDRSGYSLLFVHDAAQALVPLFPTVGLGHSVTHDEPDKNFGELHDKHVVAVPEQVAQLVSQVLQILLSARSAYSFVLVQLAAQALVPLFPIVGLGQAVTHVEELRNSGAAHERH